MFMNENSQLMTYKNFLGNFISRSFHTFPITFERGYMRERGRNLLHSWQIEGETFSIFFHEELNICHSHFERRSLRVLLSTSVWAFQMLLQLTTFLYTQLCSRDIKEGVRLFFYKQLQHYGAIFHIFTSRSTISVWNYRKR